MLKTTTKVGLWLMVLTIGFATANAAESTTNIQPGVQSNAQPTNTLDAKVKTKKTVPSHWNVETQIQAHSVAGPASPWLGIGAAYKFYDFVDLGLRGYVPLAHTVDDATYGIQGYLRFRVYNGKSTDFFTEIEGSENFYDFIPFTSYGASVGALTRVTQSLRVGVAGGAEITNVVIDSIGLENESSLVVYPKVGLIANITL